MHLTPPFAFNTIIVETTATAVDECKQSFENYFYIKEAAGFVNGSLNVHNLKYNAV